MLTAVAAIYALMMLSVTLVTPAHADTYYYVANTQPPDAFLALRTEPSSSIGRRIKAMPNGTVLQVLQRRTDGWWFVREVQSGAEGWALSGQGNRVWIACCLSAPGNTSGTTVAASNPDEPEDYTGPFTTHVLYTMCSEDDPLSREKCNLYLQGLVYGIQTGRRMQERNMAFCLPEMSTENARLRLLDFINGVTEGKPSNNKDDGNWIAFVAVSAGYKCKR